MTSNDVTSLHDADEPDVTSLQTARPARERFADLRRSRRLEQQIVKIRTARARSMPLARGIPRSRRAHPGGDRGVFGPYSYDDA